MKTHETCTQQSGMPLQHCGYGPGHPWYYKLGGIVPMPRQILAAVRYRGYRGYNPDPFDQADKKAEPERSATLRSLGKFAYQEFRCDLERYRHYACQLRAHRQMPRNGQEAQPTCAEIYTSMSLKYNHLYNRFAHLVVIEDYLSHQPDLFDF